MKEAEAGRHMPEEIRGSQNQELAAPKGQDSYAILEEIRGIVGRYRKATGSKIADGIVPIAQESSIPTVVIPEVQKATPAITPEDVFVRYQEPIEGEQAEQEPSVWSNSDLADQASTPSAAEPFIPVSEKRDSWFRRVLGRGKKPTTAEALGQGDQTVPTPEPKVPPAATAKELAAVEKAQAEYDVANENWLEAYNAYDLALNKDEAYISVRKLADAACATYREAFRKSQSDKMSNKDAASIYDKTPEEVQLAMSVFNKGAGKELNEERGRLSRDKDKAEEDFREKPEGRTRWEKMLKIGESKYDIQKFLQSTNDGRRIYDEHKQAFNAALRNRLSIDEEMEYLEITGKVEGTLEWNRKHAEKVPVAPPAVPSSAPAPTVELEPEDVFALDSAQTEQGGEPQQGTPPAPTAEKSLQEMNLIELDQTLGCILAQSSHEAGERLQFLGEVLKKVEQITKDMSPEAILELALGTESGNKRHAIIMIEEAGKLLAQRQQQAAQPSAVPPNVAPIKVLQTQTAVPSGGETVPATEQAPPAPTAEEPLEEMSQAGLEKEMEEILSWVPEDKRQQFKEDLGKEVYEQVRNLPLEQQNFSDSNEFLRIQIKTALDQMINSLSSDRKKEYNDEAQKMSDQAFADGKTEKELEKMFLAHQRAFLAKEKK